jgi:hypothetical protein
MAARLSASIAGGRIGSVEDVNLADRLAMLERLAEARGVDVSTHTAAIQRRVESVEKRLHERAAAGAEQTP